MGQSLLVLDTAEALAQGESSGSLGSLKQVMDLQEPAPCFESEAYTSAISGSAQLLLELWGPRLVTLKLKPGGLPKPSPL